jgi:hypothetical protein
LAYEVFSYFKGEADAILYDGKGFMGHVLVFIPFSDDVFTADVTIVE